MAAMKSGSEVVLNLAAQLASLRAVLVLVRTWATGKPWQHMEFHLYSILADCLDQSKQTVRESADGTTATESRKAGKKQRKRRYADLDASGAKPEPKLGPHGPTLKRKQVPKALDWLDLRLGLQPADSTDITQDFGWPEMETKVRDEDSFFLGKLCFSIPRLPMMLRDPLSVLSSRSPDYGSSSKLPEVWAEAMDPAGSPSSTRKGADPARPSSSSPSAPVPGWRGFPVLGTATNSITVNFYRYTHFLFRSVIPSKPEI